MITPTLETLPVYVRGGSIVPLEPLTQSTEETPKGPLTLRIYPATNRNTPCTGEVYAEQPQGRVRFDAMAPFVFDFTRKPRDGVIDLCGLPW